jgi:hypothetical protein
VQGFAQHALPESGLDRVAKHEIDPASEESLQERLEVHVGAEGL